MALQTSSQSHSSARRLRGHVRTRGVSGFLRLCTDEAALRTRALLTPALLRGAARFERPVLVGPWVGEVGFEVLYWIPLVRRLLEEHGIPPQAVVAVSRGGCASWYQGVADRYVDALDLLAPEDYAHGLDRRRRAAGDQKQVRGAPLDRRLAAAVRSRAQLPQTAITLHPAVMHSCLRAIWARRRPAADIERFARFATLPAPVRGRVALPRDPFAAMKTYYSEVFPDVAGNRRWVLEFTAALAARLRVVTPVNRTPLDGHADVPINSELVDKIELRDLGTNLALQSDVFARAAVAVSTYGGMAYVPVFHGVPTVALRAADGDNLVHLEVARLATARLQGVLEVVDIRQTTPTETAELVGAVARRGVAAQHVIED